MPIRFTWGPPPRPGSGRERRGEGGESAPLAAAAKPCRLATLEVLRHGSGEPAPREPGAARERRLVPAATGEHDEWLQELGAADDPDDGVLGPVEVVREGGRLSGLAGEVGAEVRGPVRDRTGDVLRRERPEEP